MAFYYRAVIMLLLASGSLVAAAAQENSQALERKVDQVFADYNRPDSPGCALGVVRNGEFLYKRGYGTASLELGVGRIAGLAANRADVLAPWRRDGPGPDHEVMFADHVGQADDPVDAPRQRAGQVHRRRVRVEPLAS